MQLRNLPMARKTIGVRVTGSENYFLDCSAGGFDTGFDVIGPKNVLMRCSADAKPRASLWSKINSLFNTFVSAVSAWVTFWPAR